MNVDQLPSWHETPTKQSIVEFVAAVTDPDSPDFVPERDHKWTVIDMAADWANVHAAT